MTSQLTEMVREGNTADFEHYHDGNLWFRVMWTAGDLSFQQFTFPVPISDVGSATVNRSEKAMLLMRYIRKHLKTIEEQEN
jgi:hypothetical protein